MTKPDQNEKQEQSRLHACCKATKRHLIGQLKQFGAVHSLRAVCWYLASFARSFGPEDDKAALDRILDTIIKEFDGMESVLQESSTPNA